MMLKSFSKKQWLLLLIYCGINCISSLLISLHSPFYRKVAADKGATASQFGFVFGAYYLTIFFTGPLYGKLIPLFGATFVCGIGTLIMAVASILFGFLDMLYGADIFIGLSVAIRVAEGIGSSAFRTASLSIISKEFCDNIESAFSLYQTSFHLGLTMGPVIGGALFDLGGFIYPFLGEGALLLCCVVVIVYIPKHYYKNDYIELKTDVCYSDLIKLPYVVMGLLVVFGAHLSLGLVQMLLEPHVKSLELNSFEIGGLLFISGITVGLSSPFWGKFCESYLSPHCVWSIGTILNILSLQLFGPAAYLNFDLNIYSCTASLLINGIAEAAQTVAAYSGINRDIEKAGIPMDLATTGLVSTLFTSSLALGLFAGPTLGGFLYDSIGIPLAIHVYSFYHLMLGLGTLVLVLVKKKNKKNGKCETQLQNIYSDQVSSYQSILSP